MDGQNKIGKHEMLIRPRDRVLRKKITMDRWKQDEHLIAREASLFRAGKRDRLRECVERR